MIVFVFFFRGRRRGCTGSSSRNVSVIRVRFAISASQVGLGHFPAGVGTKLVNQDSGYDGSTTAALPSIPFSSTFQESVIREFPFQRCYINDVSSILNLFPFPIYVGNRECPEGNQIDAGQ
jgi:hypothetical protein